VIRRSEGRNQGDDLKSRLTIFVALILVVTACGGGDETGGDATTLPLADTTTTGEGETTTTTAGGNEEAMDDGVHTAQTDLGTILVDPDGFTLYIFTADSGGESTCYDACADLWPPIPADTAISAELDGSIFGSTTRTDGSEQLTVNGMPLSLYTPDTSPGDTTGQDFNGVWFVVDANGEVIGGPEASTESSGPTDDGLDY
jgi:predicted lipoprotein with Yx(FWY)xxD motif